MGTVVTERRVQLSSNRRRGRSIDDDFSCSLRIYVIFPRLWMWGDGGQVRGRGGSSCLPLVWGPQSHCENTWFLPLSSHFPPVLCRFQRTFCVLWRSVLCSVCFRGPQDTCFEGGVFPAVLSFPSDYPLSPPKMRFTCDMFHPNSESTHRFFCLWKAAQ